MAFLLLTVTELCQLITKVADLSHQLYILLFTYLLMAFDFAVNVSL